MANKQYIGARYVPKFYEGSDGINWDSNTEYEPLTIVRYLNDTYTSKIPVPSTVGNPKNNPKYWARTGTYNAQVEQYREQLINGQLGNGEYDADISPVSYADDFNFEDAFINHSTNETVETDDECPTPIIVAQKEVTYNDPDGTADENFKFPVSQYNEAILQGFSANSHEAITQNFTNIYSTVKHRVAGIVGACCFGGRMRMPKLADAPAMATYGGNKGAIYDGHLFTETEYNLGGYGLGAELGIFDDCTEGTSPVYENNDYNVFTRKTHVLNIVGGGKTQPITAGIVLMGVGYPNGMWNGIIMGGSSTLITKNGTKQAGVHGTVGINFASWRNYDAQTGTGGFAHTAIKFGKAYRHIDAPQGFIISSSASEFVSRANDIPNFFRLVSSSTTDNELQFANVEDVTADTLSPNVHSSIHASSNGFDIYSFDHAIRLYDVDTSGDTPVNHGIVITQRTFTPLRDDMSLGYYSSHSWATVASQSYQLVNNNEVAMFILHGNDNNSLISENAPLRLVDRTNPQSSEYDYGIEITNGSVSYSRYDTTLGTATKPWVDVYATNLHLGNTQLSESQLQSLLALL